jgi:hypothetical protein
MSFLEQSHKDPLPILQHTLVGTWPNGSGARAESRPLDVRSTRPPAAWWSWSSASRPSSPRKNQPNKVLEHQHAERLDFGTTGAAVGSDPAMATFGNAASGMVPGLVARQHDDLLTPFAVGDEESALVRPRSVTPLLRGSASPKIMR